MGTASGLPQVNSIGGLTPLFVKADRSNTGLLLSSVKGHGNSAAVVISGSPLVRTPEQTVDSSTNAKLNSDTAEDDVISYADFFRKNEAIFSAKKVDCELVKEGSTDEAYSVLVESFQLLYCRR